MKKLLIIAFVLLSVCMKAQFGTAVSAIGGTVFTGSLIYYIVGEPKYTVHTQAGYEAYSSDLSRYRKISTGGMIGGGAMLITGLFIRSNEIRLSKSATAQIQHNGLTLTYKW